MRGRVLLGWLTRDRAVAYLQNSCVFNPPLTSEQAEALWAEKRAAVDALPPRSASSPARLPMTPAERETSERFLSFARQQPGGTQHIEGVIKLDPHGLVCRQFEISLDRADQYAADIHTATWSARNCLQTQGPLAGMNCSPVSDGWNINLPHSEFVFTFNGNVFGVAECAPYISVSILGRRTVLWAGYHRCYARMAALNGNTPDCSILAAVTTKAKEAVKTEPSLSDLLLGERPPLFGDFMDERLFLEVELRRKRYELQIRAEVVKINAD